MVTRNFVYSYYLFFSEYIYSQASSRTCLKKRRVMSAVLHLRKEERDELERPPPSVRSRDCATLTEWANAKCSGDGFDNSIKLQTESLANRVFEYVRDGGKGGILLSRAEFVSVMVDDLSKMLKEYAETERRDEEKMACVGRRVHSLFLRFVASKKRIHTDRRLYHMRPEMMRVWAEIWERVPRKLKREFGEVTFGPNDEDACDPSELVLLDHHPSTGFCNVS